MSFAHGSLGAVKVKGYADGGSPGAMVTLCVKKWEASLKKTRHDTSSTCNTTWQASQVGKKVVEFTIEAQLDLTKNPLDSTGPDLSDDYAKVQLYVGATTNPLYDMPTTVIDEIKITDMENDIITYSITGVSSGTVTINGTPS